MMIKNANHDCRYGRSRIFGCATGVGIIVLEPDWTSDHGLTVFHANPGGLSKKQDQDWRTSNGRNGNG